MIRWEVRLSRQGRYPISSAPTVRKMNAGVPSGCSLFTQSGNPTQWAAHLHSHPECVSMVTGSED